MKIHKRALLCVIIIVIGSLGQANFYQQPFYLIALVVAAVQLLCMFQYRTPWKRIGLLVCFVIEFIYSLLCAAGSWRLEMELGEKIIATVVGVVYMIITGSAVWGLLKNQNE